MKSALWYPGIVIIISALVIGVIMVYVIPKFEELFVQANMQLPAVTMVVLAASHFVAGYWYLILFAIAMAVFGFMAFYKSEKGRQIVDTNILKVPVFGPLVQKGCLARSCRTFASMLSSGVFALDCLDISADTAGKLYDSKKHLRMLKIFIVEGGVYDSPILKK